MKTSLHRRIPAAILALTAAFAITGCQTVYDGRLRHEEDRLVAGRSLRRIVLLPMDNATADPGAARAIREFVASAMAEHGIRFVQTEESLLVATKKAAAGDTGLYPELSKLTGNPRYFITGTVHEYRYMADLEGSPAVGFTLRVVDARDGSTLWSGTAANTGWGWKSLSELCSDSARKIAATMPVTMMDESAPPRTCVRTGKPAYYTYTGKRNVYEVDLVDGSLSYSVDLPEGLEPKKRLSAETGRW